MREKICVKVKRGQVSVKRDLVKKQREIEREREKFIDNQIDD